MNGGILTGIQTLADTFCGFVTGGPSTGTTPQTLLSGVSDTVAHANNNSLFTEILGLGGNSGNIFMDLLDGASSLVDSLLGLLGGNPFTSIQSLLSLIENFLGNIPIVGDIFNLIIGIPAQLLGIGSLTNNNPNLLSNGGFDSANAIHGSGSNGFDWDNGQGHTTGGALKITADGTLKAVKSNPIAVAQDDELAMSVWVKWTGVTATAGQPFKLQLVKYFGGLQVGAPQLVQAVTTSGAAGGWSQLTGSYTIPAGLDQVRLRLVVEPWVSEGLVWWDDASLTKNGMIQMGWISGLLDIFNRILGVFGPFFGNLGSIFNLGDLSLMSGDTGTFDPAGVISIADNLLPGIGTILSNVFDGITGLTGGGRSHDEMFVAVTGQTDTLAGLASATAAFVAANGPGNPDSDDFEGRTTMGGNWVVVQSSGSNQLAIPNSHDAHYSGSGEFVARKDNIQAAGDGHTSTTVLATSIPAWPFFTPLPFGGYTSVWLGMTNFTTYATRTGVQFEVNSNAYGGSWTLKWYSSGAATTMATGACGVPSSGSSISLDVTGNKYTGTVNGKIVCDFTDAGNIATRDASHRYRGFGGRVNGGQGAPDYKQWVADG